MSLSFNLRYVDYMHVVIHRSFPLCSFYLKKTKTETKNNFKIEEKIEKKHLPLKLPSSKIFNRLIV